MQAILATLKINSLYSIRIPYTWQHAITYPVLPPSAVIGLVANAYQRFTDNDHPLACLENIQEKVIWAGSRLLTPCIIKNYNVSTITGFRGEVLKDKFTDVFSREFAFSKELEILLIFQDNSLVDLIAEALQTVAITCGDSESSATVTNVQIRDVRLRNSCIASIETPYPVLYTSTLKIESGKGSCYYMHEKCMSKKGSLELKAYLVPVFEDKNGLISPTWIKVQDETSDVLDIENLFPILINKQN